MHCFAKISSHLQRKRHKFLTCYFNFREKTKVNCNQGREILKISQNYDIFEDDHRKEKLIFRFSSPPRVRSL